MIEMLSSDLDYGYVEADRLAGLDELRLWQATCCCLEVGTMCVDWLDQSSRYINGCTWSVLEARELAKWCKQKMKVARGNVACISCL